jgi:acetyl-CoA carboxylase alpha subunit
VKRKQLEDSKETQQLLLESHLVHQERLQMTREDQRIRFGKYFQRVLQEFEKKLQKEQLIREKRELEEARVRKIREETRNLIES